MITRLIRQNAPALIGKAVDKIVVQQKAGETTAPSLPRKLAGALLLKVATKSVPGAIVVGGALLAKHLHDRKKAKSADTQDKPPE